MSSKIPKSQYEKTNEKSLQPGQEYNYITMSFQTLKQSELLLYLLWTINNSLLEIKKKKQDQF